MEGEGGVFVGMDSDGIDAHLNNGVVIASWLGHVAEIKDVGFFDFEFFEEMSHAEFFVHTWSNGVDRGGATDFVVKLWREFFAASDDFFAFFAVWIPGVFGLSAGFLAEG